MGSKNLNPKEDRKEGGGVQKKQCKKKTQSEMVERKPNISVTVINGPNFLTKGDCLSSWKN